MSVKDSNLVPDNWEVRGDYEVYQKPAEQVIREHFYRLKKSRPQDDKLL